MSPVKMSKIESGIRAVLDFNKACNRHDVPSMMQLIHDDGIFENAVPAPDGAVYTGKEAITQYWLDFFHISPNAQIKIEDVFGFGKQCVMRWRYVWTDAAGEEQHIKGIDIYKVEEGYICEILSYVKGNW
jgi:predicted SnoaL-like aldol condensation-catalyzing enzyme